MYVNVYILVIYPFKNLNDTSYELINILKDEFTGGDVYDPQAYVSDIEPKDKKKKARKRKKDTRAIIVFGDKNARQAIKEAHNLKTPKVTKKTGGKIGGAAIPCALVMPAVGHVSSDVSSGAHNYFDSFQGSVATIPSIQLEEVESVAVEFVAVQPESQTEVIQPQHIKPSSLKTGNWGYILLKKNFSYLFLWEVREYEKFSVKTITRTKIHPDSLQFEWRKRNETLQLYWSLNFWISMIENSHAIFIL